MVTDVEASTSLAIHRGDIEAREVIDRHRQVVRSQLAKYDGREVDAVGDGFLAAFESARDGIRCALGIHDSLSGDDVKGKMVKVRIGLNAGDVVCSGRDISGSAISGAARVVALAASGEVLVSHVAKELAHPMPGATFVDRGQREARGFDRPIQVFEVKEERSLSIAIAEDNLLVREGVMSVLGNYADVRIVATCGDLKAIQEAVDARTPDVVITDIRMPPTGTDEGLQLAEWLREYHSSVAVVVLSQYGDSVYVRRLLASGAEGRAFLLKESIAETDVLRGAIRTAAAGGTFVDPQVDVSIAGIIEARDAP